MAWSAVSGFRIKHTGWQLDQAVFLFSVYVVPALLALAALIALVFLPNQFRASDATTLPFSVLRDDSGILGPADALTRLAGGKRVMRFGTKLSEAPIWFSFTAPASAHWKSVEFPSRHAQTLACWRASDLALLGSADRSHTSGAMRAAKAGFALSVEEPASRQLIVCRGTFSGPAQLTVLDWDWQQLWNSELDFFESSGLIAGGLLTLAVFVFVTALINREWTYVIFSVWLVGNLRLCANAMGWDTQWLDRALPPLDLALIRKVTFAVYYLLTAALFSRLFRRELRQVGYQWMLRATQYAGLVLLALAFALPYARFIPVLWIMAGAGIGVVIFLLGRLVWKARSRTVMWYVASLATVLVATLSQVLGAAFGIPALAAGVSPVAAALSSSMMAAFAIAEQMRAEREHRRQAQIELRNTYEVMPVGLFTLNTSGRFIQTNPALRSMLNMLASDYRYRHWNDYFQPGAWGSLQALLMQGRDSEIEIGGSKERGTADRRYLLKAIVSKNVIEGSLQDVTERSKAVERLRFLAEHDPLTGSLNRRGIEAAISQQDENALAWALAYVDLDRFKLINDLFGHHCGDEVLKQVASRAQTVLDERCAFGRMGGDEFVCVFGGLSIDEASRRCEALLDTLNNAPYQVGKRAFQVYASVGLVACSPTIRGEDALSQADRACREAKESAHKRLVVYQNGAASFEERAAELRLVESFRLNHLPPGLFLVMQPIMSMAAPAESLNFEVLLRMRAPDGTIVPPGKIMAAAEESGNVAAIDKWVVASTLAWIDEHRASLANTRFICVNLSGGSLNDERFTEEIFALLQSHRPALDYLCLEITESVALHDLLNTQRFIARAHEMGATIALDDFGAGYTSFRYLKSLSVDALKIDGEYVKSMCSHPADMAIVEALVSLARDLGMRSVAEWVEDADTLAALHEIGVDYVQGYAIARPQEADAILLAQSSASFVTDPDVARVVRMLTKQPGDSIARDMDIETGSASSTPSAEPSR
jgi:diguanylate cyclase (GGDEF)-like protein